MTSLFPSAKETEDTTKGGMVVIKITPPTPIPDKLALELNIEYKDMDGKQFNETNNLDFSFEGGNNAPTFIRSF